MLNSYSPKDVNASFQGVAITGFAEDSMIRIKRNEDVLTETVGARGELSLTKNANKTGEIEIELMMTSTTNLKFAALLAITEAGGPILVGQLIIQEPSGSNLTLANNAYLKKVPDIELAKDQTSRVWTFGCENLLVTDLPSGFLPDIKGFTL
jgi:hypothetical protein